MNYAVMPYEDYKAACDKVREKTGKTDEIKSGDMAGEIDSIQTGSTINNQDITITENGEYSPGEGFTGFGNVSVEVPDNPPVLQDKEITENGTYTAGEGYDGLGEVTVNVPSDDPIIEPLTVTENGTYTAPDGVDGYSPVTVNVAGSGGSDDGILKAIIERTATNPTLPSDLTTIGGYAFQGCYNLALTELPAGVTTIGGYAFYGCYKLALTELPAGVTSIGNSAFLNCYSLALTELPAGVTSINSYAFQGCTKLAKLTFNGKPSNIGSSAFKGCTNLLTVNVPWAEGEVANAPWGATNATINYNYTGEAT